MDSAFPHTTDTQTSKRHHSAFRRQLDAAAPRLAEAWPGPKATHDLLHSLLHDRRAGRKGFPAVVRRELKILRFHSVTTQPARAVEEA